MKNNRAEAVEKARQTDLANQARYNKQAIRMGQITLKRVDEYNWAIIRKGRRDCFYNKLVEALRDIPHKLLQDGEKKTLDEILDQVNGIHREIDRMFNLKLAHLE